MPPILNARGEGLAQAWKASYIELFEGGLVYKRDDPNDSGEQIEASMTTEIINPDADPFIHMKAGTNAVDAPLLDYYYEMMGAKKGWLVDLTKTTEWEYMYETCFTEYPNSELRNDGKPAEPIDQKAWATKRIIERPYSRRTKMITWYPPRDTKMKNTPCLQGILFLMFPQEDGNWLMDMRYNFRSRNVVDASFGNMQGLYMVGCDMRDQVEKATGKTLDMRMVDHTDSYHVNSHSYPRFRNIANQMVCQDDIQRMRSRAEIVPMLQSVRFEVEDAIIAQTAKSYKGNLGEERARVHAIGDRIFYLLDKYSPK